MKTQVKQGSRAKSAYVTCVPDFLMRAMASSARARTSGARDAPSRLIVLRRVARRGGSMERVGDWSRRGAPNTAGSPAPSEEAMEECVCVTCWGEAELSQTKPSALSTGIIKRERRRLREQTFVDRGAEVSIAEASIVRGPRGLEALKLWRSQRVLRHRQRRSWGTVGELGGVVVVKEGDTNKEEPEVREGRAVPVQMYQLLPMDLRPTPVSARPFRDGSRPGPALGLSPLPPPRLCWHPHGCVLSMRRPQVGVAAAARIEAIEVPEKVFEAHVALECERFHRGENILGRRWRLRSGSVGPIGCCARGAKEVERNASMPRGPRRGLCLHVGLPILSRATAGCDELLL